MSMKTVMTEPVDLNDGYVLMNTEMLLEAVAAGNTVELPAVYLSDSVRDAYAVDELAQLGDAHSRGQVVSVKYVGDEDVQCIEIDDEDHLYLTDGFIPSHNTSNIVFLKSTDDQMIETLEKMSGKTHQVRAESKRVSQDLSRAFMKIQGPVDITLTTKEEPVISYNDFALIAERNSIIFRAGDNPIWNRNETILPMAWRLFQNKIVHPGHEYTLQTIPTLSSALDFDRRANQPDFQKMLKNRLERAMLVESARRDYMEAYGYGEPDMQRLDPDVLSDAIMDLVDAKIEDKEGIETVEDAQNYEPKGMSDIIDEHAEENTDVIMETEKFQALADEYNIDRYAGGRLNKGCFCDIQGVPSHQYDQVICAAYTATRSYFANDQLNFSTRGASLYSADGKTLYIHAVDETQSAKILKTASGELDSRVYADYRIDPEELGKLGSLVVEDAFLHFLVQQDSWKFASGKFEDEMARLIAEKEEVNA